MAKPAQHTVLIVEDDPLLCLEMSQALAEIKCTVQTCHTAEDGLQVALKRPFDLILLDVMMPGGMGGWELCKRLREHGLETPIIFITALADTENIVHGLAIGADDYITKPFNSLELQARIGARLRRNKGGKRSRISFGNGALEFDLQQHLVLVQGEEVSLTVREFQLLEVLVTHAGQVIRTSDLISKAWGVEFMGSKQNIKPYIHYLRKKLEQDPAAPRWINTIRGVGYRFGE